MIAPTSLLNYTEGGNLEFSIPPGNPRNYGIAEKLQKQANERKNEALVPKSAVVYQTLATEGFPANSEPLYLIPTQLHHCHLTSHSMFATNKRVMYVPNLKSRSSSGDCCRRVSTGSCSLYRTYNGWQQISAKERRRAALPVPHLHDV